jgi:hypothetical protein
MITSISFVGTQSDATLTIIPAGPGGPAGPIPAHSWSGTSLRFQLPNLSWGEYTDLRGLAPDHEWSGTSLKFKEPGGDWGDSVDLKGEPGDDGDNAYVYIAFASDDSGTDFTTTFDADLDYIAVKSTTAAIETPAASDFSGLWKNYKGQAGNDGADGNDGDDGADGADGADGWTPVEANVTDGDRVVRQVVDWIGGTGTKPATGKYVGETGLVDDIEDATDIRGAAGEGTGDVSGPAGATDGHLVVFDGTTGKLLEDGGKAISDFATAAQGAKADSAIQPGDIGTAATHAAGDFATSTQGGKADSALQPAAIGSTVQGYDANTAKTDTAQTWTAAQKFAQVSGDVTAVSALNIDCSAGNEFTKTIDSNSTFTVSNVPSSRAYEFRFILTYTSGTITWFSGVRWILGSAPTLTGGKVYEIIFTTIDGGSTWRAAAGEYAA